MLQQEWGREGGGGNLPSLIPALWNIGILLHKQATHAKHFGPECKYVVEINVKVEVHSG